MKRLFIDRCPPGESLRLDHERSNYLVRVLRSRPGDPLLAFDGRGSEYAATVVEADHKRALINVADPVRIILAIFRGAPGIPPPYPEAAADPTPGDPLSCER